MSESQKGRLAWNKGLKYSEERKNLMRGFKHSEETKKNISEKSRSRKRSEEEIKKLTDRIKKASRNRIYKPLSDEHKKKTITIFKRKKTFFQNHYENLKSFKRQGKI